MTIRELTQLLTDPSQLNDWSYEALDQLLLQYPYCNGLRMLLLKKYKNDRHVAFNRHLMLASMYAVDRGRLYDFLNTSVVANATTKVIPLAASDTHKEQKVILVEPPPVYNHKVSDNPPILAFQPPLTAQDLGMKTPEPIDDREEWSAMPVEEWLNSAPQEVEGEEEPMDSDNLAKKPFKLSRIPVFDENMFDFLEEEEEKIIPTTKDNTTETIGSIETTGSTETVTRREADVFDFFMEQTNSFLKSLNERKESKGEREWQDLEDESTTENDAVVSETLAELLALQGQNAKAIKMYAALSLKFPEKSRLFADKIAALEV
ncbi:MAG: hypothetical protein AB8E82_04645 [Aureispira sp.]